MSLETRKHTEQRKGTLRDIEGIETWVGREVSSLV